MEITKILNKIIRKKRRDGNRNDKNSKSLKQVHARTNEGKQQVIKLINDNEIETLRKNIEENAPTRSKR